MTCNAATLAVAAQGRRAVVGATGVAGVAAAIEQAGKAGDHARCGELLARLAAQVRRALLDIESGYGATG
jgi:hypothetical protein